MSAARGHSRRLRSPRFRSTLVVGATLVHVCAATASAQAGGNNHWRNIDAVEREMGGIARVSSATPAQIQKLTDQLLLRGQFYQDLADLQAVVARDHAGLRDSIGRRGGAGVSVATYYRGRALQELGLKSDAAQAYRALPDTAPAKWRALATAWRSTLAPGGARSWQQDLVDWRNGQTKSVVPCAPDATATATACAMLKAIVDDDVQAMYRLQRSMVEKGQPADYRTLIREGNDPAFAVQFYDPLLLSMLAAIDYAIAANLLKGRAALEVNRGIALLRIGRVSEATPLLRSMAPYYGEALYRAGSRREAEAVWKPLTGALANVAWDVKSTFAPDVQGMLSRFRADSVAGLARMQRLSAGGSYLARALLRHQLPDQALQVLESVVPEGAVADLNAVLPSSLVLLARARYEVGSRMRQRDLFPLARGPIASMARDVPILLSTLDLLQQVTMPPNIADMRTR